MTEFAALRPETYKYLTDHNNEKKKAKSAKNCVIKYILKLEDYKHCLEANQLENKIKILEKNKLYVDKIIRVLQKIMQNSQKNNKLILKLQQRFRSEKHNAFKGEVNKIALNANNDQRMQSMDSIETYAYGTNEE